MIINDIWGSIRIESKYEKIINSKEFNDLKNKNQLGLNCNLNAVHTRYQHSIGTYYLACKLVNICKNKFSDILNITKEDEEAIKCMALVHDVGHGCFSHVSEKFLEGTHENRTQLILTDPNSEIHKAIVDSLGQNVLEKVVYLIQMKEKIKDKCDLDIDNNLIMIIGKLLSGGIDIDRIDYIFRDSKYVYSEINDYSNILEHIDLGNINDSLEVIFGDDAEFLIANFFNKRFELYDRLYYDNYTKILESVFGKFIEYCNIKLNWNITEVEMKNIFRENLNNENQIISRYANLLDTKKLDNNFLVKEINDKNSYDFYKKRLINNIPELEKYSSCLFESSNNIGIYNKSNKIFINNNGLIQDISDSSKILNSELKKDKYVLAIDLYLLEKLLKHDNVNDVDKIIEKVKKHFSIEIEQEKKYTFSSKSQNPIEEFKKIKDTLGLTNVEYIENYDTYYDENNILETYRIALRKRVESGNVIYTIKKPLNDSTSISKRDEKNFNSLNDALLFLQEEWKIPIKNLKEKITLKTLRSKYDTKYGDGTFEIVFDKTTPIVDNNTFNPNYMIECELKNGNSSGLYFIDKIIRQFEFIEECQFSKKEIALDSIKSKVKLNPFLESTSKNDYYNELNKFFVSNSKLLDDLKKLNERKEEIKRLKEKNGDLKHPIVVTLCGTPRAGKTTCIDNLFEFLKKADLKTVCLEEPTRLIYKTLKNTEEKKELLSDIEQQYEIGSKYINDNLLNNDIILCDGGILDTFIWYDMYYQLGMIDIKKYKEYLLKLKDMNYFNQFYVLFAHSDESMKRDYLNSLSIEPRTNMNQDNVERYNSSLLRMLPIIEPEIDCSKLIDTTKLNKMDPSIIVANDIIDNVKKLYLRK